MGNRTRDGGHEASVLWLLSRYCSAEQWIHLVLRPARAELALDKSVIRAWAEGRSSNESSHKQKVQSQKDA